MRLTIRSTLVDCCTGSSADVVIDKLNWALQDLLADPDLKKARARSRHHRRQGRHAGRNGGADALRYRQMNQGDRGSRHRKTMKQARNPRSTCRGAKTNPPAHAAQDRRVT